MTRENKDFAHGFRHERPNLDDDALWRAFEPYARVANEVVAHAEGLGVRVIREATLTDFHRTAPIMPVTTLVAHWRSARYRSEDVVDCTLVRGYLSAQLQRAISSERDDIVDSLNELLDVRTELDHDNIPGSPGYLAGRQYAWCVARQSIDATLGAAVRGGPAMEFFEGFQPMRDIVDGMPRDYRGVLDLTVCQSIMVGEEMKRRCPECLTILNSDNTSMHFRFALYGQVIEYLTKSSESYEDAVYKVREPVIKEWEKHGRRSKKPRRRSTSPQTPKILGVTVVNFVAA